eukprot:maker-scaffold39_size501901-snap-gene-1.11 protein:Tk00977 transcript:maker-scaffold39_size501901-snap-gene-1.11-mRNA-1 annotation:"purple acid"
MGLDTLGRPLKALAGSLGKKPELGWGKSCGRCSRSEVQLRRFARRGRGWQAWGCEAHLGEAVHGRGFARPTSRPAQSEWGGGVTRQFLLHIQSQARQLRAKVTNCSSPTKDKNAVGRGTGGEVEHAGPLGPDTGWSVHVARKKRSTVTSSSQSAMQRRSGTRGSTWARHGMLHVAREERRFKKARFLGMAHRCRREDTDLNTTNGREMPFPTPDVVVHKAENRILPKFEQVGNDKWKEPFYFIQAADTQLGLMVNYGDGTIGDQYPNITWDQEIELCEQSVTIMNSLRPKPKFFIVCGDLLDAMPDKWPDIRQRQQADFMRVYAKLDRDIPLVCVCGNHDVGNTPTKETMAAYQSNFGDDYFSFWNGGVHFIVLNSQFYEDASQVPDLAQAQELWLDGQLKMSNEKGSTHIVMFQHIPWFVEHPKEDKIYFNIEIDTRTRMMDKFKKHGVRKIFCGHYHRNAGGWDEGVELIVTTAIGCQIGNDFHGMRVVKVFEKEIEHKFHRLDDFPRHIDLTKPAK